jgi:hypothetical protein
MFLLLRRLPLLVGLLLVGFNSASAPGATPELVRLPHVDRKRVLPRTLVFPRTESQYDLYRNYLLWWIDRPLFFDRRIGISPDPCASFKRIMESTKPYGIDGLSIPAGVRILAKPYEEVMNCARKNPDPHFHLLTELMPHAIRTDRDIAKVVEMIAPCLATALASPKSVRINGKVVISSYGMDSGQTPRQWKKVRDILRQRFGDQFLFVADIRRPWLSARTMFDQLHGAMPKKTVEQYKQMLRDWLDVCDGVMFAGANHLVTYPNLTLNRAFYRDFLVPLFCSVLNEPAYRHKLLGLSAAIGYINVATSRTLEKEEGTRHLRDSFEIALSGHPDFIIMPEWDEVNENTCIEPTVQNSFSSERIIRYYVQKIAGQKPSPLPGDDLKVPNLIISCRHVLTLGEPLEVEVLNVPDGSAVGAYRVQLNLKDGDGKIVKAFPGASLEANQLKDHTFTVPSEELAPYPLLIPSLKVTAPDGTNSTWEQGLECIHPRPTWNWIYKWTKVPLRDLIRPQSVSFTLSKDQPSDGMKVAGSISCDEPILSVEVVQGESELFAVDPKQEYALQPGEALLLAHWQSMRGTPVDFSGEFSVSGGSIRKFVPLHPPRFERDIYKLEPRPGADGRIQTIGISTPMGISTEARGGFLIVTNKDQAVLHVKNNGHTAEVPVAKLLADGVYARTYENGLTLTVKHFTGLPEVPFPILQKEVSFSTVVHPPRRYAPVQMRVITESGKIYRSRPLPPHRPDDSTVPLAVYSLTEGGPVTVNVAKSRIPDIACDLTDQDGASIHSPAGADFYGLAGGLPPHPPALRYSQLKSGYPAKATRTAPKWMTEDGNRCMYFDGIGNYLFFPEETLPRGSFSLELEFKPTSAKPQVLCVAHGYYDYNSFFRLTMNNGRLGGEYVDRMMKHISLRPDISVPIGQWSKVKITYDLKRFTFTVNGRSASVACSGKGCTFQPFIFGGYGDGTKEAWFQGYLKSLRIVHRAQ